MGVSPTPHPADDTAYANGTGGGQSGTGNHYSLAHSGIGSQSLGFLVPPMDSTLMRHLTAKEQLPPRQHRNPGNHEVSVTGRCQTSHEPKTMAGSWLVGSATYLAMEIKAENTDDTITPPRTSIMVGGGTVNPTH